MIIEKFFDVAFAMITTTISLLPNLSFMSNFLSYSAPITQDFVDMLDKASYFLPIGLIIIGILISISFYLLKFIISIINWLIAKIPGLS